MAFLNTRDSADLDNSVETAVEGEIREFVRRDVATSLRRQPESDSEMVANNITSLLQRVAGTSVQEIDKLISELQTLRDMLQNEGARVQREIVEYATLSQAAFFFCVRQSMATSPRPLRDGAKTKKAPPAGAAGPSRGRKRPEGRDRRPTTIVDRSATPVG